jgi:hypothetical protein
VLSASGNFYITSMIPASRALIRLAPAGCAAALVVLAIALQGCGGDTAAKAGGTPVATTTRPAEKPILDGRCEQQVGGFLTAMDTLRERLVSGLSYEQYVEEIDLVRASYDRVPVDELALSCVVAAGTPGERAFARYIGAANAWGECIGESGCDAPTVEPVLQKQWRVASHLLDEAQRGLRRS